MLEIIDNLLSMVVNCEEKQKIHPQVTQWGQRGWSILAFQSNFRQIAYRSSSLKQNSGY